MSRDDRTDLDASYLEILGEHPDVSAPGGNVVPIRSNVTGYEYTDHR